MSSHRHIYKWQGINHRQPFNKCVVSLPESDHQKFSRTDLYAMVTCTAELVGVRPMRTDWGRKQSGVIHVDSTTALGIAKRKGFGRMKHISIKIP